MLILGVVENKHKITGDTALLSTNTDNNVASAHQLRTPSANTVNDTLSKASVISTDVKKEVHQNPAKQNESNYSPHILHLAESNIDVDGYSTTKEIYLNSHVAHENNEYLTNSTTEASIMTTYKMPTKVAQEEGSVEKKIHSLTKWGTPQIASVYIFSTSPSSVTSLSSVTSSPSVTSPSSVTSPIPSTTDHTTTLTSPTMSSELNAQSIYTSYQKPHSRPTTNGTVPLSTSSETTIIPSVSPSTYSSISTLALQSTKNWLYDGLQPIINSQILDKQYLLEEWLTNDRKMINSRIYDPLNTLAKANNISAPDLAAYHETSLPSPARSEIRSFPNQMYSSRMVENTGVQNRGAIKRLTAMNEEHDSEYDGKYQYNSQPHNFFAVSNTSHYITNVPYVRNYYYSNSTGTVSPVHQQQEFASFSQRRKEEAEGRTGSNQKAPVVWPAMRSEDVISRQPASQEWNQQENVFHPPVTLPAVTASTVTTDVTSAQLILPEEDDTCVLPPDAGNCFNYVPRWFYNSQTGKCEQFSYGSCGGNSNNFLERQACEVKCSQSMFVLLLDPIRSQLPERCTYQKDEGFSNGYNVQWYFNVRNLRCEQMVYQGQGGNWNRFQTLGECQNTCIPLDVKFTGAGSSLSAHSNIVSRNSSVVHLQSNVGVASPTVQLPNPENVLVQQEEQNQERFLSPTHSLLPSQSHAFGVTSVGNAQNEKANVETVYLENEQTKQLTSQQLLSPESISQQQASVIVTPSQLPSTSAEVVIYDSHEQLSERKALPESQSIAQMMDVNHTLDKGKEMVQNRNDESSPDGTVNSVLNGIQGFGSVPNCPNGLKPVQDSNGRPMTCLPGRNQCSANSLCYFNGVNFYCCPNAEDPYDEHIFGGYGGEEVKRGYKSMKKTQMNTNDLIVRKKYRVKRQLNIFSTVQPTNTLARIDCKFLIVIWFSMAKVSAADNNLRSIPICRQEVDVGKCAEAHLRYFYDHRIGTCRLFYYSGCGGNENNFATEMECRQECFSGQMHLKKDQGKFNDGDPPPGQCPFGKVPLGDNAPVLCGNESMSFGCPKNYYCRMGPPHVCCPKGTFPDYERLLAARKLKNVRFAAHRSGGGGSDSELEETELDDNRVSIAGNVSGIVASFNIPSDICPDGSDALLNESTQQPLRCGAGFDGESLCPIGYYCSISTENSERLCCPLALIGVKIPPPPKVPPFFGLRPSNPGEVILRGSLPSDVMCNGVSVAKNLQIQVLEHFSKKSIALERGSDSPSKSASRRKFQSVHVLGDKATNEELVTDFHDSKEEIDVSLLSSKLCFMLPVTDFPQKYKNASHAYTLHYIQLFIDLTYITTLSGENESPYGRMMLKPKGKARRAQAFHDAFGNPASSDAEANEVHIDVGEVTDPFDGHEYLQKSASDRSVCLLKPNEGRTCREDETPPRTNLQYFYSKREKICKLFFYRGCGGSQNRFDSRKHCETMCAVSTIYRLHVILQLVPS
ncbi:unnamed protein product [Thelazia callipaeda]|uniref:BPTI/Kunitz inhibitor domain-containing protein n=1 Tax=Thelazia callipaeda TaxID=103827 RepID=A0A0N5D9Y4_THECL|nr:unnamed protein product [Thelazia callipaeda]